MEKDLNNHSVQKPESITLVGDDGEKIVFTYEFVEDEEELEDMFRIFGELMSDAEIDFRN